MGPAQLGQGQLRKGNAGGGQVHRQDGGGLPYLPGRPLGVEGLESEPAGLGVDVLTRHDTGRDLVEPALGVELASKCRECSLSAASR